METDRSGLVSGYVGQTALKVEEVVKAAMNGVLFVDEAYALVKDTKKDFGSEAIETLLKKMEDHRDELVVIVAGYPDEMKDFIGSNPDFSPDLIDTLRLIITAQVNCLKFLNFSVTIMILYFR